MPLLSVSSSYSLLLLRQALDCLRSCSLPFVYLSYSRRSKVNARCLSVFYLEKVAWAVFRFSFLGYRSKSSVVDADLFLGEESLRGLLEFS